MKKLFTVLATLFAVITLAACGNNNSQNQTSSSSRVKSVQTSSSQSAKQSLANQQSATTNGAATNSSSANKVMTTSQVVARVAQLKNVNLSGGDKIFVTPTSTPNVFKIYIKGANQDPQVDSIIDHYIYNGNTDVISQATDR